MITATFLLGAVSINVIQLHVGMIATTVIADDVQLLLWLSRNTAVGKMRNAENKMWNRKCRMTLIGQGDKPRDRCHSADYHTNLSTGNAVKWCLPDSPKPDSPKLGFRVSVSANRDWTGKMQTSSAKNASNDTRIRFGPVPPVSVNTTSAPSATSLCWLPPPLHAYTVCIESLK